MENTSDGVELENAAFQGDFGTASPHPELEQVGTERTLCWPTERPYVGARDARSSGRWASGHRAAGGARTTALDQRQE
jgi:hypothetical protein